MTANGISSRRRLGGGTARMRDVAKRAGVSTMTVSRALSDAGNVSEEMRQRVFRAVQEIGYLPNHLASSLSSSRSTTIGLIVPSIDNSIYTQTVKGLSDVIRRSGFQLMIAECGYDPEEEEADHDVSRPPGQRADFAQYRAHSPGAES